MGFALIGLSLYYFSYRYNLLFVIQPKIDTKGQAYTLALQQLLTGVYIAELSLLGLFSLRQAMGPSILAALLFIVTVLYNVLLNKYLVPLENFLPADLAALSEREDDESAPLLSSAEEGRAQPASHIQRLGQQAHVPPAVARHVVDPLARFFEPRFSASYQAMRAWLQEGDDAFDNEEDIPEYSEDQIEKAYLNPALTSQTPLIWLAQDPMGVSSHEVEENEGLGLKATDQGAWLDERGRVKWAHEKFDDVPVWKQGVKY